MPEAGHNNPPSMIAVCDQVAEDISAWLAEHPVISDAEMAKEAKVQLDRGKLSLTEMEDERDKAVRPLNAQVKAINDTYRPTKVLLGAINEEVSKRITAYIQAEEAKRIAAAQEAARLAAEAEQRARAAIQAEEEALEAANTGELGVNTKAAITAADSAIKEAEKAGRAAQVAEKESHVKVSGGFTRAASLRKVKVFHLYGENHVEAAVLALRAVGLTEDIAIAITKAAKAYYEEWGEIPPGFIMHEERKI